MVTVIDYLAKANKEGKVFFVLVVQGNPEIAVSKTGKSYLTTRKANLSSTLNEIGCQQMIGQTLPGSVGKVFCEPYEVLSDNGELIKMDHRYEYQPEEVDKEPEKAVFQTL